MNSRGRSRKEQKSDIKKLYGAIENMKPPEIARKQFKRRAYEIHDVSSYINSKYGTKKEGDKGEIRQENFKTIQSSTARNKGTG